MGDDEPPVIIEPADSDHNESGVLIPNSSSQVIFRVIMTSEGST